MVGIVFVLFYGIDRNVHQLSYFFVAFTVQTQLVDFPAGR